MIARTIDEMMVLLDDNSLFIPLVDRLGQRYEIEGFQPHEKYSHIPVLNLKTYRRNEITMGHSVLHLQSKLIDISMDKRFRGGKSKVGYKRFGFALTQSSFGPWIILDPNL